MQSANPYQAPSNDDVPASGRGVDTETIASGQKYVIGAAAMYLAVAGANAALPAQLKALVVLGGVALVLSVGFIGAYRICKGLKKSAGSTVLTMLGLVVPLVGLLVLVVLNSQATKALRGAGWSVGFLGATPPRP